MGGIGWRGLPLCGVWWFWVVLDFRVFWLCVLRNVVFLRVGVGLVLLRLGCLLWISSLWDAVYVGLCFDGGLDHVWCS